jgi:hypothetical protein
MRTAILYDFQERILKLYPNPASDYVILDFQKNYRPGLTIQIYSGILGKKVFESINAPPKININLRDYNRGVYLYHVIDSKGKIIESGKFQVSR